MFQEDRRAELQLVINEHRDETNRLRAECDKESGLRRAAEERLAE